MSVNWKWNEKVGEIDVLQKHPHCDDVVLKYDIYNANCLGCFIYELSNEENEYIFEGFFGDESHMKKCLGLMKCPDGSKSNACDFYEGTDGNYYGHKWIEVRLDCNWINTPKWARNLMKAKMRVVIDDYDKKGWNAKSDNINDQKEK